MGVKSPTSLSSISLSPKRPKPEGITNGDAVDNVLLVNFFGMLLLDRSSPPQIEVV